MTNDTQMLHDICKSADMGIESLENIVDRTDDNKLKESIQSQISEYKNIYDEAESILKKHNEEPKNTNPIIKTQANIMSNIKMIADDSDSKVAEMIIQGSTMGITSANKALNDYSGNNKDIKALMEKQIKIEQSNIEEMKKFL